LALLALGACASLSPQYEQPSVSLSSFRALPSEGMTPAFEIGLRVINPNPSPLELAGVVYTISIEGHDLVKGVGKGFPVIDGYGQGEITLTASANLLAGIRLLGDLMQVNDDALDYDFEARLDLSGLHPSIRVHESGAFNLQPSPQQ
jgi:LEA14-like dessication related protein